MDLCSPECTKKSLTFAQNFIMGYIFLCIFCSSIILIVFKLATNQKLDIFKVIMINYLVASAPGILFSFPTNHSTGEILNVLPWASMIGFLFISIFFLVGKTTAVSGMAITSIASKMSVVIPVLFSILYYKEATDLFKISGIALALVALFLAVYTKQRSTAGILIWLMPVVLFFGNGLLDSIVKFTQAEIILDFDVFLFNTIVFGTALVVGLIIWPIRNSKKGSFSKKTLLLGTVLGIANFGSLFAMVKALGSSVDSSMVFLINNTGILVLASLTGVFLFKERLSRINTIGIILAVGAIVLLSFQTG
jgi:drug/metabolite transporter (DMT)-like permease